MIRQIVLYGAFLAIPAGAVAQAITFTVKDGRPLVVGGETELGTALRPVSLDAEALVGAFDAICLPDAANAGVRAEASALALTPVETVLLPVGEIGEARIMQWQGDAASVTVWSGDETNLKGRPIAMPSRGATTTGPYGPFKAFGTQCNLVVKVEDFSAAQGVIRALSARYGEAEKLVQKKTFADGHWDLGNLRINVNVPTTRSGPQPLHMSVQLIPSKES